MKVNWNLFWNEGSQEECGCVSGTQNPKHHACLILVMYMIIMYAMSTQESNPSWDIYWLDYFIISTLGPGEGEEQPANQTIRNHRVHWMFFRAKLLPVWTQRFWGKKRYILTFKMCIHSHKDQGMPVWAAGESWVTCEISAAEGTRYPFSLLVVPVSFCLKWSICCCPN